MAGIERTATPPTSACSRYSPRTLCSFCWNIIYHRLWWYFPAMFSWPGDCAICYFHLFLGILMTAIISFHNRISHEEDTININVVLGTQWIRQRQLNTLEKIHIILEIRSALTCNAAPKSTVRPSGVSGERRFHNLISWPALTRRKCRGISKTISECIAGSPACH